MSSTSEDSLTRKLHRAFELFEAAREIMRQNLRRRNPDKSEAEIEALLQRWIQKKDEIRQVPWTVRRHNRYQ